MTNEEFLKSITLDDEEWREAIVRGTLIFVSDKGRIVRGGYSINAVNPHGFISVREFSPKLLKQSKFNTGKDLRHQGSYLTVTLGKNGHNRNRIHVHQLVATVFLSNPNNYPHIDHIDGDRGNNCVENLRFCTAKVNMNNPITKPRIKDSLTGKPSSLRIPVIAIFSDGSTKIYESMLATKQDNYSPNRVYYCCKGLKDIHKGVRWMYLSDYKTSKSAMSKNSLESGEG